MAPSRVTKPRHTAAKAPSKIPATDEEGASQQSSQSSEGDDKVVKMAERMRRDVRNTVPVQLLSQVHPEMLTSHQAKARQRNRRTSIIRSYEETMQKIEDDINATFDEISRRARHRHKQRMERLYDILRRKSEIEGRMIASAKRLDDAYDMAEKALVAALERRIIELGRD